MPCYPGRRSVAGLSNWTSTRSKVGHLQSLLSKADRSIIPEVNRLVREVRGQKEVGMTVHQLCAESDDDLALVAWSDAALANRADLGSTGGFIIGFVHRSMLDDGVRGPVNVMSWSSNKLRRVSLRRRRRWRTQSRS